MILVLSKALSVRDRAFYLFPVTADQSTEIMTIRILFRMSIADNKHQARTGIKRILKVYCISWRLTEILAGVLIVSAYLSVMNYKGNYFNINRYYLETQKQEGFSKWL